MRTPLHDDSIRLWSGLMAFMVLLFSLSGHTQEKQKQSDPFDLSTSQKQVKELGVPTVSEVQRLENKATNLFNTNKCKEAIPALEKYAKQSNWLANLISAGLDPYYGAPYQKRKNYPYSKLNELIPYEDLSNSYKIKRNIAIAMHGECLIKIGDKRSAVSYLLKALDLISLDNYS